MLCDGTERRYNIIRAVESRHHSCQGKEDKGSNNDLCFFRFSFLFLSVIDGLLVGAGGCHGRTCIMLAAELVE